MVFERFFGKQLNFKLFLAVEFPQILNLNLQHFYLSVLAPLLRTLGRIVLILDKLVFQILVHADQSIDVPF